MTRILVVTLLLISSHASALSTQWISLGAATRQGNPIEINGNSVIEFRNAGRGGIDWDVSGIGPRGGLGARNCGCLIIQQLVYLERVKQPQCFP